MVSTKDYGGNIAQESVYHKAVYSRWQFLPSSDGLKYPSLQEQEYEPWVLSQSELGPQTGAPGRRHSLMSANHNQELLD